MLTALGASVAVLIAGCASGGAEDTGGTGTPQGTVAETQAAEGQPPEPPTDTAPTPTAEPEPEEPPYVGNDAAYDYLMAVRENQPDGWDLDGEALPTRQEVTGRVLPEMVNPERCADLASIVEAGYLVQEGPIQYIQDLEDSDGIDNFVVIGQAPLESLSSNVAVLNEYQTFVVSRRSPSVINNSPTQDVVTYEMTAEVLASGYVFITFTGEGEIQIVDPDNNCLWEDEGVCMYPRSVKGYRLIRQEGETLIVAAVTKHKNKGGTAPRPMKKAAFLQQAQRMLDSLTAEQD